MTRPIVWAFGVFAAIGVAASGAGERLASLGLSPAPRPQERSAVAPKAARAAEPIPSSAGGFRVETVHADSRGHFSLDGRIDGTRIQLMVDTGASLVVLREEDAERIGIHLRRADFTGRTSTANGTGSYAPVRLRWLQIGEIEIRDVEAAVVPRGQLAVNLLGMSFLKRLRSFDIANDRITLRG